MKEYPFSIIQDTREQTPFDFGDWPTSAGTLTSGDYSIGLVDGGAGGLTDLVAIERKSLGDLCGCICGGRDRFKRELLRLQSYRCKAVVIEATLEEIYQGEYRSRVSPESVIGSIASWQNRYKVPFVFAGGDRGADYTLTILRTFYNQCKQFADQFTEAISA